MDAAITKDFLDACNEALGFLVVDHGFHPAILEVDDKIHFATVSYQGKNAAVECIFDQSEHWVEVKIARGEDGARPVDYSIDSSGRRIRVELYTLLIERGVRGFGPRVEGLSKKPLSDMFRIILFKDADLLKKHCQDVITDAPRI